MHAACSAQCLGMSHRPHHSYKRSSSCRTVMMSRPMLSSASTSLHAVVRQCEVLYTCELLEIWSRRERSTPLHDISNVRRHASLLRQIRRKQRGGRILQGSSHGAASQWWFRASAHERRCAGSVIVKRVSMLLPRVNSLEALLRELHGIFADLIEQDGLVLGLVGGLPASSSYTMHPTAQQSRGGP